MVSIGPRPTEVPDFFGNRAFGKKSGRDKGKKIKKSGKVGENAKSVIGNSIGLTDPRPTDVGDRAGEKMFGNFPRLRSLVLLLIWHFNRILIAFQAFSQYLFYVQLLFLLFSFFSIMCTISFIYIQVIRFIVNQSRLRRN